MNEINKTTKRLLSASRLGILFEYNSGHRYIKIVEGVVDFSFLDLLEKHKILINSRVDGNIIDCLNFIDYVLNKISRSTLEEMFDQNNEWGFDDEFVGDHTNWEDSGVFGEDHFEKEIRTY